MLVIVMFALIDDSWQRGQVVVMLVLVDMIVLVMLPGKGEVVLCFNACNF